MKNDRSEIRETFDLFIKAWESGSVNQIDEVMIEAPFVNMSIFEPVYSREILKYRLVDSLRGLQLSGLQVSNWVCRINGGQAQQSAVLSGEVSGGTRENYCFCGMFVNHYEKTHTGWKITEMNFDLRDDNTSRCGFDKNNRYYCKEREKLSFAVPAWNMIWNDIGVFDGCRLPAVCGELQAPWVVIPEDTSEKTEYEKLQEFSYRYIFSADYRMTRLFADAFVEGAALNVMLLGEYAIEKGVQAVKASLQASVQRGLHVVKEEEIKIDADGGFADVKLKCQSPGLYNETIEMIVKRFEEGWKILSVKTTAI